RNDVVGICRRLDELPLAIELAASKLASFSEREIASQLSDNFSLLTARRSPDPRHQTISATIEWSYRLLTETEAVLLRRFDVFRGGFSIDSATAICTDAQVVDVVSTIGDLVSKSMLVVERLDDGTSRYRLLESHVSFLDE